MDQTDLPDGPRTLMVMVDGEPDEQPEVCTLGEFIDANETLSEEELVTIVKLKVDEESPTFGGGAAPTWAVKRIR